MRLSRAAGAPEDLAALPQAVREYFAERAVATRTQLRRLLRAGGWSLLIGVAFVAAANLIGEARLFDRLGAMHVQVVRD